MNKEEILEKSRLENRDMDIYEKEVLAKGNTYSCILAAILATVFFIIQIFTGGGMNYGLYAIVFSMSCATFWYKYIKLHRKHELALALGYTLIVVLFSAAHIYNLISASAIM